MKKCTIFALCCYIVKFQCNRNIMETYFCAVILTVLVTAIRSTVITCIVFTDFKHFFSDHNKSCSELCKTLAGLSSDYAKCGDNLTCNVYCDMSTVSSSMDCQFQSPKQEI